MVEDGAADPRTARLAAEHGARHVALGAPRGLNVARNAAIEAARRGPPVLPRRRRRRLARAGSTRCWRARLRTPDHDAFGGPIRARLEGTDLHACGREPAPITTLDLGPEDRDAELVWGANLALRRSALARAGGFDPARSGPGDEEEWERRLRAAGGRIRYLAAAGVDHRRTGADARIAGLVARRLAPRPPGAPLRRGQGHGARPRRRAAHARRLRLAHRPPALRQRDRDERAQRRPDPRGARAAGPAGERAGLPLGQLGHARPPRVAGGRGARPGRRRSARCRSGGPCGGAAASAPPRRVLVAGVARPELQEVAARGGGGAAALAPRRRAAPRPARARAPASGPTCARRSTRTRRPASTGCCSSTTTCCSPPASSTRSCSSPSAPGSSSPSPRTGSRATPPGRSRAASPASLARRTRFVEIGPVTALHRDAFAHPAAVPRPADGLGPGRGVVGARGRGRDWRSASSTPPRSGTSSRSPRPTRARPPSRRRRPTWRTGPT